MQKPDVKAVLYPEVSAGGFTHIDGTINFYTRINALLAADMTVVDFGAGRGAFYLDDKVRYRRDLRHLRGKVQKVIGLDVDPIVKENHTVDESFVIQADGVLPLADQSVDMFVADWTFEHIANPASIVGEIHRVLKPGGWICARTPNLWGYIGVGANLVPNRLHKKFMRTLQKDRKDLDVFPTVYQMNTFARIERYFPPNEFKNFSYTINPEPAYFGNSKLAWLAMMTLARLLPPRFGATLLIFLKRRP